MLPAIEAYLDSPAGGNQGGYLTNAFCRISLYIAQALSLY
jgi:hypothetical protein